MADIESFTVFDGLHETDPEDRFFEHIVVDEVLQAIDRLSPQFREALLQSVEGLQYDEIARVTGVAVGTVKSRLFRGRQVLHDALYDYAVEQRHIDPYEDADLGETVRELVGAS